MILIIIKETNSGEADPAVDELVKGLQQQLRQSEKSLDIQKQVALQYRYLPTPALTSQTANKPDFQRLGGNAHRLSDKNDRRDV